MIYGYLILLVLNSWYIYGLWFSAQFEFRNDTQYAINMDKFTMEDVDRDSTMILWRLRYYSLKYFGEYWSKCIIICPPCMASVHSFYVYWAVRPVQSQGLLTEIVAYIAYAFALSGLNSMFIKD